MTLPADRDNRVLETTSSTGLGNLLLGGAENGYYAFFASFGAGVSIAYVVDNPITGENECGLGEIVDNGDATYSLQRNTVERSSNANAKVNFAAGRKYVRNTILASEMAILNDATLTAFAALTIAANTLTIGTGADAFSQTAFAANTFPARASTGDLVAKSITDYGLTLVAVVDAAAGRTALGLGTVSTLDVDTDTTLAANSDAVVPSQKAVKTYVDTAVTGLLDFKGATDCSTNPNYPAASKGDAYVVSVAGKIGGASGESVEVGDVYVASADNAGGTEASVGTSWFVLEHNLAGALLAANNLSDLTSASTARTNLGLGSLATMSSVNTALTGTTSMVDATVSGGLTVTGATETGTLTVTGTTQTGSMTIGQTGANSVTVNAQTWTLNNAITFSRVSQASTAETLMTWVVSDDATSKFEIINGSATDAAFSPTFKGTRSGAGVGVTFVGNATTDTGANPLTLFRSTISDGAVTTRPLFAVWNNVTSGLEMTAGYNLQLKGGSTSPTLASAAADLVSLAAVDVAAGDRQLYARPEAGQANRLTGLRCRVSSSFSKTSDTTLANVTGLTRNVAAGEVYAFRAVLFTTSAATGGVKCALGGTATATSLIAEASVTDGSAVQTVGTTRVTALSSTFGDVTAVTAAKVIVEGQIVVNAAGTLTIQFAQNASDGTASVVLAGSYFELISIGA